MQCTFECYSEMSFICFHFLSMHITSITENISNSALPGPIHPTTVMNQVIIRVHLPVLGWLVVVSIVISCRFRNADVLLVRQNTPQLRGGIWTRTLIWRCCTRKCIWTKVCRATAFKCLFLETRRLLLLLLLLLVEKIKYIR